MTTLLSNFNDRIARIGASNAKNREFKKGFSKLKLNLKVSVTSDFSLALCIVVVHCSSPISL